MHDKTRHAGLTARAGRIPRKPPPVLRGRALPLALAIAVGVTTASVHADAITLGAQAQQAATDLTMGSGYIMELLGYVLGGSSMLLGGHTIWQHTRNPNGQHRMSFGIVSVLIGGFFLALSTMAQISANTVSGGNATITGTAQQLQIQ